MKTNKYQSIFIIISQIWAVANLMISKQTEIALFFLICQSLLIAFSFIISRLNDPQNHKTEELWARIHTFWWMLTLFALALTLDHKILILIFFLLSLLAIAEYFGMTTKENNLLKILSYPILQMTGILTFVGYLLLYFSSEQNYLIFQIIISCIILPCYFIFNFKQVQLFYPTLTAYLFFSFLLPFGLLLAKSETELFLLTCFLTEIRDLISYWLGKFLAKSISPSSKLNAKIASDVSPNKTWLTGVITLLLLVPIFYLMTQFVFVHITLTPQLFIIIPTTIGVLGLLGDLVFSMIKRMHDEKDSGQWLPGGSGLIDRIDSLVFTLPVIYFILNYL